MADTIERLYKLTVDAAQAVRQLNEIAKSTENVDKRFDAAVSSVKKLGAALGVGFAAREIVTGIKSVIDGFDQLAKDAQKVGIAAEDLQRLRYAADLSGVGAEQLNTAIGKLSVSMSNLGEKGNKAGEALAAIGVKSGDSASEALAKIADEFARMPDGIEKTALAITLFGKAGADMIPLLNGGSKALKELTDEADRFGGVVSGATLAAAEAFNDNLTRLQRTAAGAGAQLTAGLLPALQALSQSLVDSTTKGDGFVSTGATIGNILIGITALAINTKGAIEEFGKSVAGVAVLLTSRPEDLRTKFKVVNEDLIETRASVEETVAKLRKSFDDLRNAPPPIPKSNVANIEGAAAAAERLAAASKAAAEAAEKHRKAEDTRWKRLIDNQGALDAAQKASDDALTERNSKLTTQQQVIMEADKATKERLDNIEKEGARLQYLADLLDETSDLYATGTPALREYARSQLEVASATATTTKTFVKQRDEMDVLAEGTQGFFDNLANGAADAQAVFQRAIQSIIAELLKLWAKKFILDAFKNSFGGGSVTVTEPGLPVSTFASGGTASSPIVFPTAQATSVVGAESIPSLRLAGSGGLGMQAQAAPMNVTVINNGNDTVTTRQRGPNDLEIIIEQTRAAIASDLSRGGSLVSKSLENTYGLGRGAAAQF